MLLKVTPHLLAEIQTHAGVAGPAPWRWVTVDYRMPSAATANSNIPWLLPLLALSNDFRGWYRCCWTILRDPASLTMAGNYLFYEFSKLAFHFRRINRGFSGNVFFPVSFLFILFLSSLFLDSWWIPPPTRSFLGFLGLKDSLKHFTAADAE